MYRIGMFSKLGKTTIKTLRYYDEVGLLTPAYVNEENGYHYYATDQLFKKYRFPLKSKD
ncbi:multidrug-efflux transporter 1 regulator [Oxobacter pfennigii]|uniref:Multidrug-efflux transporter 1 regulator n=2 Tax=Oxobacter pfennigii TaxID=36849 RepID=A0A0P8WJD6_9CLOT|nr:multidrug-efflux transporter 1 regulator [Oxobacter pfennigii]